MSRIEKQKALDRAKRRVESGPMVTVPVPVTQEPVSPWALRHGKRALGRKEWETRMYQNDEALFALIAGERKEVNHNMAPEEWLQPDNCKLYDRNPCRLQVALMTLRGPALKLTREELAAYCGIARMTVYRQEATNWELVDSVPCWLYLHVVLKWGNQCWGHLPNYHRELHELAMWCKLSHLPRIAYLAQRPKPRPLWGHHVTGGHYAG
jgi:hypothetical protein